MQQRHRDVSTLERCTRVVQVKKEPYAEKRYPHSDRNCIWLFLTYEYVAYSTIFKAQSQKATPTFND